MGNPAKGNWLIDNTAKELGSGANRQVGRELSKLKGRLHAQTGRRRGNALFLFRFFVGLVLVNDFLDVVSN